MHSGIGLENYHNTSWKWPTVRSLQVLLWEILLFLMLFMPRNIQEIKTVILVTLTFLTIIQTISCRRIELNRKVVRIILLFLSYALLASLIGFYRLNPGVSGFFRVNVIYYILFTFLITGINNMQLFMRIIRTILLASNAISIYSILLLLVNLGVWPESLFIKLDPTSRVGIHPGYTHLVNTNLSMMIFIAPFVTILFIERYSNQYISKRLIVISEILLVIAVILSGRRVLWISLFLPFLMLLLKYNKKVKLKKIGKFFVVLLIIITILLIMNYYLSISLGGLADRFFSAFQGSEGGIRINQISILFQGFLKYPIFGSGAGIGVSDLVRSTNNWVYELSYNLILYNSGLVGSILYATSLLLILFYLWKWSRQDKDNRISTAIAIAYISALISNATNPYFSSSFDFLWFIFIPLMFINIKHKDYENLKLKPVLQKEYAHFCNK